MDKTFSIREGREEDLVDVLELNQVEAKWTSNLSSDRLTSLINYSNIFLVAEIKSRVSAFLVVIPGNSDYLNNNLGWFRNRIESFWYVDRIVVSQTCSGMGIGRSLYDHLFQLASESQIQAVACEYSTTPMNEVSAAFHRRTGFVEIGTRADPVYSKVLSMQLHRLKDNSDGT